MKNYIDEPIKIVYNWYLKYLWTQDIFLGDFAMAFPFHVVEGFHSRKYVLRKISIGIYFHILVQY